MDAMEVVGTSELETSVTRHECSTPSIPKNIIRL